MKPQTALFILLLASTANTTAAPDTPENAVREYLAARDAEGFVAMADRMHPDEQAAFKEVLSVAFQPERAEARNMLAIFGPDATLESVTAMPPDEFVKAFFGFIQQMVGIPDFPPYEAIVGTVTEDDVVHVILRYAPVPGALASTNTDIVSVRRDGTEWRILMTADMRGVVQGLTGGSR